MQWPQENSWEGVFGWRRLHKLVAYKANKPDGKTEEGKMPGRQLFFLHSGREPKLLSEDPVTWQAVFHRFSRSLQLNGWNNVFISPHANCPMPFNTSSRGYKVKMGTLMDWSLNSPKRTSPGGQEGQAGASGVNLDFWCWKRIPDDPVGRLHCKLDAEFPKFIMHFSYLNILWKPQKDCLGAAGNVMIKVGRRMTQNKY